VRRRWELARDPEKWEPVFGKDHAQNKSVERDDDSKKNHPALRQLVVFSPNGVFDDRLRVRVPVLRPAVITDAYWDFRLAVNIPLVGPLAECDLLVLPRDMADFAKVAALRVV
jgi:hypothetical protein